MGFNPIDSLSRTGAILDLIAKRQSALSSNVANVDTPGYVRKEVDFAQHLGATSSPLEQKLSSMFGDTPIQEQRLNEPVNVADELIGMQQNTLMYTVATRRMSNVINQMKTVLNVGK